MRAMTSVGPPAGKPTTTRTERLGYPSAWDAATPDSTNAAARNMRTTGAMALSPNYVLVGAIIGEGAEENKSKASRPGATTSSALGTCFRPTPLGMRRRAAQQEPLASARR